VKISSPSLTNPAKIAFFFKKKQKQIACLKHHNKPKQQKNFPVNKELEKNISRTFWD
jgi:hypothetical protein